MMSTLALDVWRWTKESLRSDSLRAVCSDRGTQGIPWYSILNEMEENEDANYFLIHCIKKIKTSQKMIFDLKHN
jgi:hypothetical protein